MQPVKLIRMKRTNFYSPARRVWFQKNDDSAQDLVDEAGEARLADKHFDYSKQRLKKSKGNISEKDLMELRVFSASRGY